MTLVSVEADVVNLLTHARGIHVVPDLGVAEAIPGEVDVANAQVDTAVVQCGLWVFPDPEDLLRMNLVHLRLVYLLPVWWIPDPQSSSR